MTPSVPWLPPLCLMEQYGGNWHAYLAALYAIFQHDFIHEACRFRNQKIGIKRYPKERGKEATFWHMISEGKDESARIPDPRRCERIGWPRPVIDHSDESCVLIWENQRSGETRICLWLQQEEYLVVLAKRSTYLLLWTAYPVVEQRRKIKLSKEYNEAQKKAKAAIP